MTETATEFGSMAVPGGEARRRLAIVVSLVLILSAAAAALFLVRGVDTQLDDVARTYEVRRYAQQLMLSMTGAETGQRGYLLTLDASYLDPYERAVASIEGNYDHLLELLAPYPERHRQIAALRDQIERKRAEMSTTINLAAGGQIGNALSILRSDAGRSLMEDITSSIRAFTAQEDDRLAARNADVERYRQWLVAAILAALAGAATLAYALFNRTQRQVAQLARTRSTLMQQNEELEAHVRRRTVEVEEARAHAERERARVEALLRETNHRIGNSLATVSSLLGLQLQRSGSDEVRTALEAAQSRVQAIASGHRRLRLGADLETTAANEFLGAVVEDIKSSHAADRQVEFVTELDPLVINARDATTIGIVLGELVTNALKHAFTDKVGTIWIRFAREADEVITLTVEDSGPGFSEGNRHSGLGSMIIRQLAMQYGGTPKYETREGGGARVCITFPGLDQNEDETD